ncbi:RHS repeat domain-containing protein [Albidovulum sediminis]|uniref:RHS repeat-associated core domain-containing protein n=1 Tax=Albidovulum sediminis TaxID=3066345 RepID=A0ABT2NSJ1_9RHOB|nr:RHS repeat-associated core domain-containing protein [Defluviimonas sediminis]
MGTLHLDGLGSVRAVTDETGLERERTAYRPYGEEMAALTPLTLPETKGYIGERYDDASGLQYLNARYYDPKLGLFIQPDWWEVTKEGVGTNWYSYSFGDPVNGRDPTGHAAIYKDGKYKGQVNPGEPGYKEITCGCGGSGMMPSDWVEFNKAVKAVGSGYEGPRSIDEAALRFLDRIANRNLTKYVLSGSLVVRIHWSQKAWRGITSADLTRIYATKIGAKMLERQLATDLVLDIRHNVFGFNIGCAKTGEIYLDYDAAKTYVTSTPLGTATVPTDAILVHEMGHAVLGIKDDGSGKMNNVNSVENPCRIEVGLPVRLTYCGIEECE